MRSVCVYVCRYAAFLLLSVVVAVVCKMIAVLRYKCEREENFTPHSPRESHKDRAK